ncbi:MAG: phosphatase PAP2 family protein, partial [Proteobacteria bacterium]|nr:phosphatase PAP2 family protein [Pseudomonadota bacterium]
KKVLGHTTNITYGFLSDTVSDVWNLARSPLHWRWKGWLTTAAVVGVTTGLIFLADDEVREAAKTNIGFAQFGEDIRWLGTGPGLAAVTAGFGLTGLVLQRDKELETMRLLLESSTIGFGYVTAFKYTLGRYRPGSDRGPKAFEPFRGNLSMPSGEATNAFLVAGVVTSQYPNWPTRIAAYGVASLVGIGRIASDDHWTSDIFASAALGIAMGKAIVYFNRRRALARAARSEREGRPDPFARRHFVQLSPRGFRWTYRF